MNKKKKVSSHAIGNIVWPSACSHLGFPPSNPKYPVPVICVCESVSIYIFLGCVKLSKSFQGCGFVCWWQCVCSSRFESTYLRGVEKRVTEVTSEYTIWQVPNNNKAWPCESKQIRILFSFSNTRFDLKASRKNRNLKSVTVRNHVSYHEMVTFFAFFSSSHQ